MLAILRSLGVAGGIGALIGIGLVAWIDPTTTGGIGFLIVIPILVSLVIGEIARSVYRKKGEND